MPIQTWHKNTLTCKWPLGTMRNMSAKYLIDFEVSISEHWDILKDSSFSFRKIIYL
jgi:CDP-glycerol glycerophosphotransferase (TagB/SpsB family)